MNCAATVSPNWLIYWLFCQLMCLKSEKCPSQALRAKHELNCLLLFKSQTSEILCLTRWMTKKCSKSSVRQLNGIFLCRLTINRLIVWALKTTIWGCPLRILAVNILVFFLFFKTKRSIKKRFKKKTWFCLWWLFQLSNICLINRSVVWSVRCQSVYFKAEDDVNKCFVLDPENFRLLKNNFCL